MMDRKGSLGEEVYHWYNRSDVKFEIIKQLKNKEFAMLISSKEPSEKQVKNIRTLRCHSVQHFDYLLRRFRMFEERIHYNFYKSCETYGQGVPIQNLGDFQTRKEQITNWAKNCEKDISGTDILLDWDADVYDDLEEIKKSVVRVHAFCNQKRMKHSIVFSGRGIHLYIYKFEDYYPIKPLFHAQRIFTKGLLKNDDFIDRSVITPRRLVKLPYSLAIYKEGTFVVYPFSSIEEFLKFDYRDFEISRFKQSYRVILKRGLCIFNEKTQLSGSNGPTKNGNSDTR